MEDDFLSHSLVIIEREIVMKFRSKTILIDFGDLKDRRTPRSYIVNFCSTYFNG